MDVRSFTVGPVAENCYVARRDGAKRGVIFDPGDEAERILEAVEALGIEVDAILLTHCHFDHIGAVAPVAKATGAPVHCPEIEVPVLADIMSYVPWPGFGPFESYDADETVAGDERLSLAGLEIDVRFTPGHSPGHVTYSIPDEQALFSGDVLFKGSVGTFDVLPVAAAARGRLEEAARDLFDRAGYARIETPIFEDTDLFARGVGSSTDIVRKEMFTFEDQGGRSITLRPEGTAPIARAYLEHGMRTLPQPVKLWYAGPFFRHERPQAGRFRQFNQIGAEAIGSDSPLVDAELIMLLDELLRALEVPELRLRIGSLGSPPARA